MQSERCNITSLFTQMPVQHDNNRLIMFNSKVKRGCFSFAFPSFFSNFATKVANLLALGIKKNKILLPCSRFLVTLHS